MERQRKFKCTACGHEFEQSHGTGKRGHELNCPSCGAQVYRLDGGCGGKGRGNGQGGRGKGFGGGGQGGRGRGRCGAGEGSMRKTGWEEKNAAATEGAAEVAAAEDRAG